MGTVVSLGCNRFIIKQWLPIKPCSFDRFFFLAKLQHVVVSFDMDLLHVR